MESDILIKPSIKGSYVIDTWEETQIIWDYIKLYSLIRQVFFKVM